MNAKSLILILALLQTFSFAALQCQFNRKLSNCTTCTWSTDIWWDCDGKYPNSATDSATIQVPVTMDVVSPITINNVNLYYGANLNISASFDFNNAYVDSFSLVFINEGVQFGTHLSVVNLYGNITVNGASLGDTRYYLQERGNMNFFGDNTISGSINSYYSTTTTSMTINDGAFLTFTDYVNISSGYYCPTTIMKGNSGLDVGFSNTWIQFYYMSIQTRSEDTVFFNATMQLFGIDWTGVGTILMFQSFDITDSEDTEPLVVGQNGTLNFYCDPFMRYNCEGDFGIDVLNEGNVFIDSYEGVTIANLNNYGNVTFNKIYYVQQGTINNHGNFSFNCNYDKEDLFTMDVSTNIINHDGGEFLVNCSSSISYFSLEGGRLIATPHSNVVMNDLDWTGGTLNVPNLLLDDPSGIFQFTSPVQLDGTLNLIMNYVQCFSEIKLLPSASIILSSSDNTTFEAQSCNIVPYSPGQDSSYFINYEKVWGSLNTGPNVLVTNYGTLGDQILTSSFDFSGPTTLMNTSTILVGLLQGQPSTVIKANDITLSGSMKIVISDDYEFSSENSITLISYSGNAQGTFDNIEIGSHNGNCKSSAVKSSSGAITLEFSGCINGHKTITIVVICSAILVVFIIVLLFTLWCVRRGSLETESLIIEDEEEQKEENEPLLNDD